MIVWGEFGRTPKINAQAGRDHWPNVSCALLAGGGLRTGQVIGTTDRHAAEVVDRPVRFEEVHATLYNRLGIDPTPTTVNDLSGRPQYIDRALPAAAGVDLIGRGRSAICLTGRTKRASCQANA